MLPEPGRGGASIELVDIAKRYDDEVAVDSMSLKVEPGEFVTLLGPSGSGKTTTLNLIAGFVEPDSGEIFLNGKPVTRVPTHKRNLGVVFQNYALFPHMTVFDNVAFPLRYRHVPRGERREQVRSALELVQLEQYADRYPRQLSGGQQQRVALARAMVFNPVALLLDEPLGALDKKLREHLQLEIRRLHRDLRITFLYVTHDQAEALALSERIAVFNAGRVEQVATPEVLYEHPETLFVASFVGDSNSFHGVLRPDSRGAVVVGDGFALLCAHSSRQVKDGDRCIVVVRPEHVSVVPNGANASPHNLLEGRIAQVLYLGSNRVLEVEVAAGQTIHVKEASDWSPGDSGDRVRIGWDADKSILLPEQKIDSAAEQTLDWSVGE